MVTSHGCSGAFGGCHVFNNMALSECVDVVEDRGLNLIASPHTTGIVYLSRFFVCPFLYNLNAFLDVFDILKDS